MAIWDSADLLARCKRHADRPDTDADMPDPDWYALLEEAQVEWTHQLATMAPFVLMGAPTKLSTADGGATYTFPNGIQPLAVQVFDALNGRLLRPGAYWDTTADYVWEGSLIRFPRGASKTFTDGPYARYVSPASTLDGTNAPSLQPPEARVLLVYRALVKWASRGGLRDPSPFQALEDRAWYGAPERGELGLLGALKQQNHFLGAAAFSGPRLDGFSYLATVANYKAL